MIVKKNYNTTIKIKQEIERERDFFLGQIFVVRKINDDR